MLQRHFSIRRGVFAIDVGCGRLLAGICVDRVAVESSGAVAAAAGGVATTAQAVGHAHRTYSAVTAVNYPLLDLCSIITT